MGYESKLLIKAGFVRTLPDDHPYQKYVKIFTTRTKDDFKAYVEAKKEEFKISEFPLRFEEYVDEYFDTEFQKLASEKGAEADDILEELADHDYIEAARDQLTPTFHPRPIQHHHVIYESPKEGVEPIYFWCLNHLQHDLGFPVVHKITDVYAAAEHSSFYGAGGQRLGLAQDRVSQLIAQIGKMIKELFNMVREIRIHDERLAIYKEAMDDKSWSADRTLKGMWVDLVDGVIGGQRTGSNLYNMATQVGFQPLPQLFFNTNVSETKDIEDAIKKDWGMMNNDVKGALASKLQQYLQWRKATRDELHVRRKFSIDYLAQHFNIIRMYMAWAKPYLKRTMILSTDERRMDTANIISSFETSYVEIEILAKKVPKVNKVTSDITYACVLLTLEYQTRPQMAFQTEGYHKGPLHSGSCKMTWRCYGWDTKKIEAFMKMKAMEDMEMLKLVDRSLTDAVEVLGKDLRRYLFMAGTRWTEPYKEPEKKKTVDPGPQPGLFDPLVYVVKGPWEVLKAIGEEAKGAYQIFFPPPKKDDKKKTAGSDDAGKEARGMMYVHYKNFKKSHKMLSY